LKNYFLAFLGSGIGGILRYWGSSFVYKFLPATFPYGTLFVNFAGTTLLGFIMYYLDANKLISQDARIFLAIGICGGFTTFSAFSFETMNMLKDREYLFAGMNVIANLLVTLIALFLTYKFSKLLSGA
jgi:CrcB protein